MTGAWRMVYLLAGLYSALRGQGRIAVLPHVASGSSVNMERVNLGTKEDGNMVGSASTTEIGAATRQRPAPRHQEQESMMHAEPTGQEPYITLIKIPARDLQVGDRWAQRRVGGRRGERFVGPAIASIESGPNTLKITFVPGWGTRCKPDTTVEVFR